MLSSVRLSCKLLRFRFRWSNHNGAGRAKAPAGDNGLTARSADAAGMNDEFSLGHICNTLCLPLSALSQTRGRTGFIVAVSRLRGEPVKPSPVHSGSYRLRSIVRARVAGATGQAIQH